LERIAAAASRGVDTRPPARIGDTVSGAFATGILPDGAVKTGVPSSSQTVIKGLVISAAEMVDPFQQCLQQGSALQRQAASSADRQHLKKD
jgi:ABC-type xylose transport system permease subunit